MPTFAIFQLYHGENKSNFQWNDDEVCLDMSPYSDTLSWFWANKSLLFLLNAAYLAEKQQIPIS
jgi:hypothetical protein